MSIDRVIQCYVRIPTLLSSYFIFLFQKKMSPQCRRLLGMSVKDVSFVLVREEVDFKSLITYFRKDHGHALEGLHMCRAITLCLLGTFLFVCGSNNKGPTMLLNVVEGICNG